MKKTLVALAAVAATASYAQSSVVMSGNLDVAYASRTGTAALATGNTITTLVGNSSTTGIKIVATEDLGSGLKVNAQFEFDPRTLIDDGLSLQHSSSAATANSIVTTSTLRALGQHEMFVGLSGPFGYVQLGSPNSFSLTTSGTSSPLGTGIGSGYTYDAGTNTAWTVLSSTRYARSAKYTTPNMNGFTAGVLWAPGNDYSLAAPSSAALKVPNNRQVTEIGLNYSKGDLNLSFTNIAQAAQTNGVGFYNTSLTSAVSTSANVIAANYKFGNITGYIGMGSGTKLASATTEVKAETARYALKFNMGNVDLIAQYTQMTSNGSTLKVTGARADYNLSKTTAVYAGYEAVNTGTTALAELNTLSIGLRKSF